MELTCEALAARLETLKKQQEVVRQQFAVVAGHIEELEFLLQEKPADQATATAEKD